MTTNNNSNKQKDIFSMNEKEILKELGKFEIDIKEFKKLSKEDLIDRYFELKAGKEGLAYVKGALEVVDDGYGFLRFPKYNYTQGRNDVYVSSAQIKKFGMKKGHMVSGPVRAPKDDEKYFALIRVDTINGMSPNTIRNIMHFDRLTPYYPKEKLNLETKEEDISTRIINLFTPIGKGQRGLIVAAPRTGKTVLMQKIANAILTNHPEVHVIVLLVDERPEEVTEMKEILIKGNSEVISSTFDEVPRNHVQVAEMTLERAKRMVEVGKDVVIMLDSITRLARAYNMVTPSSGRVLSGGLDSNSLHKPKKFFGSARNTKEKGSLTIIATALVDTGSRMDQVIFEEFKGTGNMELVLERSLSDMRLFPAIDLIKSGTRREELLLSKHELKMMIVIRQYLKSLSPLQGLETIIGKMKVTKNNEEFLKIVSK
jgi:transcription termination factor Rho